MDCEKFESTLIDELYAKEDGGNELDELTSAASKRHAAGCARCAGLLGGLRATRRVAVLPLLDPPADLEERIFAAARDAQKVVPLRGRLAHVVSLAGSWAMRPQTAMAAVFLLMIGSSVLLVRGRKTNAPASASMVVTEQGTPAASIEERVGENDGVGDMKAAANAHGVDQPNAATTSAAGALASAAPQGEESRALALADKNDLDRSANERPSASEKSANERSASEKSANEKKEGLALREDEQQAYGGRGRANAGGMANAAAPAGAPAAAAPPPVMAQGVAPPSEPAAGATSPSTSRTTGGTDFASGMNAYKAKSYDEATRTFDALASGGDANAALWAARSVRESGGCAAAVARFDQVAARSYGTQSGYDATLEAGRCYKSMGSFEAARSRFGRLLTVPSHVTRAQAELDAMTARNAPPPAKSPARPSRIDQKAY
jgi:hypothetical protein